MIQQAILPFKMERTDELITPRSGLGLFAEVVRTLGVPGKAAFPRTGSNRGYEAWQYIEPLVLTLTGGGVISKTCGRSMLTRSCGPWWDCGGCRRSRPSGIGWSGRGLRADFGR